MPVLTEAQRLFFETNGYLMVEGALSPAELAAVRRAADTAEDRWRRRPDLPGNRVPEFEQIDAILEYDPLFFDLVEHPKVFPLVREVLGPDVALLDHAYYMTPPGGLVKGSAWHTDVGHRIFGVYHPRSAIMARVIYALTDVPENGGATLVLPGSHHYPVDFPVPGAKWPEEMPGHVRLACKAGSAYFYNGNLWHAPSNNRSDTVRRVLLFNYGHRWMRMWKGHEPSPWLAEQAKTPMRRQLLGLCRAYYGPDAEYPAPAGA
ncbi:MAG TPA: phytanoyl-CoA dioxygenase family protein [Thermoanaerobaculia bacterium]|nr:phytanoyl-CoA dioxygenase family protein [Thermoanaerobaculia bacterium]